MGRIVISFKIFPSTIEVDLEKLKKTITEKLSGEAEVYRFEEEPIAFGLKALITHLIIPEDLEGQMDKVENLLKEIKDISEIQTLMVRRIS